MISDSVMRSASPAARAWIILGIGILVWEFLAPDDQTLSEEVDRWLAKHSVLTVSAVMGVALHLINVLPAPVDPVSIGFRMLRHGRKLDLLLRVSGKVQEPPLAEIELVSGAI